MKKIAIKILVPIEIKGSDSSIIIYVNKMKIGELVLTYSNDTKVNAKEERYIFEDEFIPYVLNGISFLISKNISKKDLELLLEKYSRLREVSTN